MTKERNAPALKKVLLTLLFFWTATSCVHAHENAFSKQAVDPDAIGNPGTLTAPDGKTSVRLGSVLKKGEEYRRLLLTFDSDGHKTTFDVGRAVGSELLWSPDSKALAVTISHTSANGVFDLFVFQVEAGAVRKIDASPVIRKLFGHPVVCAYPEPPNVAAITWVDSSARLLVAAQILDHSICDSFGTFKLFQLDVPSLAVDKAYDQITAKRLFGPQLGAFLRAARDACITNPKSCELPTNHPPTMHSPHALP